jgi:hypothetical protein
VLDCLKLAGTTPRFCGGGIAIATFLPNFIIYFTESFGIILLWRFLLGVYLKLQV